ncbi:RNA-binding S4 domain-containing protein [Croceicoccus sp. YJ47]|uniref:RNA-binding S4 domain-containing protein n=1 Tax=Croceicoccus sp. YJ47 TaxID=2798724 RepID=UPI001F328871|nr:S4 domain-containing protein [Croceicoccus sp. YJ47]
MKPPVDPPRETLRIDRLLWMLRMAKTRSQAQALVAKGHVRLNGRRVLRAACGVGTGDVLVLPMASGVRVIAIDALPARRGPADEARRHYHEIESVSQQATDA